MTTVYANVNAAMLASLVAFTTATRLNAPSLAGVRIEAGAVGVLMVAINGVIMGVRQDVDQAAVIGDAIVVPISKELIRACKARAREPDRRVLIGRTDKGCRAIVVKDNGDEVISVPVELIEARFPDWRALFTGRHPTMHPDGSPSGPALLGMNPSAAVPMQLGDPHRLLSVSPAGAKGAMLVTNESAPDFVGLWMPGKCTPPKYPAGLPPRLVSPAGAASPAEEAG